MAEPHALLHDGQEVWLLLRTDQAGLRNYLPEFVHLYTASVLRQEALAKVRVVVARGAGSSAVGRTVMGRA